jgi:hypothetical protein
MAATLIFRLVACALLAAAGSGAALAQHVWLDAKGVKQYSDMPPPAGTPANRVLQSPGLLTAPAAPEKAAAPTVAERNAAFEKRRLEQAERENKESEQTRQAADMLASGERISRMDRNGERGYLNDQERAQEAVATRRVVEQCK